MHLAVSGTPGLTHMWTECPEVCQVTPCCMDSRLQGPRPHVPVTCSELSCYHSQDSGPSYFKQRLHFLKKCLRWSLSP